MLISNIKLENGIWHGSIKLSAWNDFFENVDSIELNIGGDSKTDIIDTKHVSAYNYLIVNQLELLNIILDNLLSQYSVLQEEYGYDELEIEDYMPNINTIEEFKRVLRPKRIYILNTEREGMSYIGFHFWCSWDDEHDFGIMMHKKRIVKMGGAENAFLSWIAEEDVENVYL